MTVQGEKTRQKLLDSALFLFVRRGIDETTTAEITKRAGVAEGTLFVHYEHKQTLINTLYLRIKEREIAFLGTLELDVNDPEACMKKLVAGVCEYFLRHYEEYRFITLVEMGHQVDRATIRRANEHLEAYRDMTRAWQRRGLVKRMDTEIMLGVTWNMCKATIEYAHAGGGKKAPASLGQMAWDAIRR